MRALSSAATATLACLVLTACTVHQAEAPPAGGPSDLALSLRLEATPDTIGFDGGSQSAVRVTAFGPDGKPISGLTLRVDMAVDGVVQDFGSLSARSVVTDNNGVARVTFTSPVAPPNGNAGTCSGLPGTCVQIVATPTSTTGFGTVSPSAVNIRLVPLGVILPPPTTPRPCITVSPGAPAANTPALFTGGTDVGTTGVNCTTATSDIVSFEWNFGDGGTASGRQVTHSFATAGAFVVTMTETNDRGIAASTTQSVTIGASAAPNARFTTSPTQPAIRDTVFFNASSSAPGAGHTITSYSWDFGDGSSGSGITPTHQYQTAGTFVVTLVVTDEVGQTGTTTQAVSVGSGNPTARLTVNKTGGLAVQADACSSTAAGAAQITTYSFSFSDGFTATTAAPTCSVTHAFTDGAGNKTVNVTVTDNASPARQGTASATVTVP
jgi:PKD repeat protein